MKAMGDTSSVFGFGLSWPPSSIFPNVIAPLHSLPVHCLFEKSQIELHFRLLDFGQVTVGSANVRNLAITNDLPHAVLAELLGVEGQSELVGSGPPAQVVPAGVTAGFDVHFKCQTEQVGENKFVLYAGLL